MPKIITTGGLKHSGGTLFAKQTNEPPVWDTIEGSLGTPFESQAFTVTPGATDPDNFPSGGTITYTLVSGSLPSGLALNSSTSEISGTPSAVGEDATSNFTLRAADGPIGANKPGRFDERDFSITVLNDVAPSFNQAANFSIGSVAELTAASLFQITATDPNTNPQTITFTEIGAVLAGNNLSLDANGNVTGSPPDSGGTRVVTFTVRASDGTLTTDQDYKLTITDSQDPIWVTAVGLLATVNESEAITTITLEATDDNAVSYSVTSGALPGGLTLNSSNGEITGTPSNVAEDTTSDFEVTATDTVESDFTARCFSIKVLNVIANSLRFNDDDSAYLNRTPSASNRTTWTWSGWVKRGNIDAVTSKTLFSAGADDPNQTRIFLRVTTHVLVIQHRDGGSVITDLRSSARFRDPSAWYHFVVVWDTDNGTADDRHRMYVNGVQLTDFGTRTNPASGKQSDINAAVEHLVGAAPTVINEFDGYMSEVNFVDGLALLPTSFGAFDSNGDWQPKEYSGAFGTEGFHFDYAVAPGTGNGGGTDVSGNGNHFTDNNLTASDQVSDSPTNNYCVLNSIGETLNNFHLFEDGNLVGKQAVINNASISWPGTIYVSSGKWHFEAVATFDVFAFIGIFAVGDGMETFVGQGSGYGLRSSGDVVHDNADQSTGFSGYSTGDRVAVELDLDTNNCEWFVNGSSRGTLSISAGTYTFGVSKAGATSSGTFVCNFGQQGFVDTPTSGFVALNSANLPTPTIEDPGDHFDPLLYTGNSSNGRVLTGLDFQPDLVWIKNRSNANSHQLYDAVRGVNSKLSSDDNSVESTGLGEFTSFDVGGFTLGTADNRQNGNGFSYVAWCWNESATPGFDIVGYTGTGVAHTEAHSLGAVPDMIIVKQRTEATDWFVYHSSNTSAPETDFLRFNTTAATADSSTVWNDTAPTSSVFSVGTSNDVNNNTKTHIAYLWAEVEGFSKFGSYTGNGSTDGPFVWCGFSPAYVVVKRTDSTGNWRIVQGGQQTFNELEDQLNIDTADAEFTGGPANIDSLSNGFKLRGVSTTTNGSGATYIFAAFAESPFKTARSR